MKKLLLSFVFLKTFVCAEVLYVIDDNVAVFDPQSNTKIGTIARGISGEKISEDDKNITIKIQGYLKKDDNKILYATKKTTLPLITFEKDNKLSTLEVSIPKDKLSPNQSQAWADAEFLYYDLCSMCHAAHSPKEHTILEWDGIFNTMRAFAMPTDDEANTIIQYLRTHASDGYATDDEDEGAE